MTGQPSPPEPAEPVRTSGQAFPQLVHDLTERTPGQQRRRLGVAAGVAAAVAVGLAVPRLLDGDPVADGPEARLPQVVNAPGTWSDDTTGTGVVAALGIATRTTPEGVLGSRQRLSLFTTSAIDGRSSWLAKGGRLQGLDTQSHALSPDGRWVAWQRMSRPDGRGGRALLGWALLDTSTGTVRRLSDPDHPRLRATMADLAFTGDSGHLLTSYTTPGEPPSKSHVFVAWDVDDATPTVVEKPGHVWLASPGSAPTGVVWSRGQRVVRLDLDTGRRETWRLPVHVVDVAWSPDDSSVAVVGRDPRRPRAPWRLYAADAASPTDLRVLDLPVEPARLVGWVDDQHVVVDHVRRSVQIVDLDSGEVETRDLAGTGDIVNTPVLAEDLWQRPLREPEEPEGTTDPRQPLRTVGLVAAGAAALVVLMRRRRRRRKAPATG